MKRLLMFMAMLALALSYSPNVDAQGFLKNLGKKVVDKAKEKVEEKVLKEEDKAADAILNGESDDSDEIVTKKGKKNAGEVEEAEDNTPDAVAQNVKSDFVRGSVILFEDNFANEQLGEFPSKWDVSEGSLETASINGKKYAHSNAPYSRFSPLMENMKSYLPEVFTLEWDEFFCKQGEEPDFAFEFLFYDAEGGQTGHFYLNYRPWNPDYYGNYDFKKGGGVDGDVTGSMDWDNLKKYTKVGQWNHFAISFNKRAFKFYINDNRVINLPNVAAPARFEYIIQNENSYRGVANVVLAKGAVELYERQTTNLSAVEKAIQETGKFVTNNILFETGKATLKPESMEEIQKVAEYMKKNPTARFEVQGHTDNQGSDKINDPLSQERAEAVVKALEGQGVDPFNLRPVGKGSHEPVADNSTEAGRAQNRRVEFIKK
jgi:outer membrane protein OmpA-like peptidoglycan-associated protein